MIKLVLAAATAFALAGAAPAYACGADCPMHKSASAEADCPMHKTASAGNGSTVAAADKKDAKATCACKDPKECKCAHHGAKCDCPVCHAKQEKKDEKKS